MLEDYLNLPRLPYIYECSYMTTVGDVMFYWLILGAPAMSLLIVSGESEGLKKHLALGLGYSLFYVMFIIVRTHMGCSS